MSCQRHRQGGFTLMELATVIVIIGILVALVIPGFGYLRARAERTKCVTNLKSLYVGVTLHIQEHGHWPQVDPALMKSPAYAEGWQRALERYAIAPENWACPSVQRVMNNPDLSKEENHRIDYFGTPFANEPNLPYRFPRQPWFIERGDMHGEGQMIIFGSGDVKSLKEVLKDRRVQDLN